MNSGYATNSTLIELNEKELYIKRFGHTMTLSTLISNIFFTL